jgi:pilus assembly protein CpaF
VFVEREGLLEREPTASRTRSTCCGSSRRSSARSAAGSTNPRRSSDARLADGSRVNAIVAPLAIDGSLLSIRKFAKKRISMARLIELGSVPEQVAEVMSAIVRSRRNVLDLGRHRARARPRCSTRCRRTSTDRERIVTIEDSAELQLQQEHVARLETRPSNIEGRGEVTQRDLVKNALRMRP